MWNKIQKVAQDWLWVTIRKWIHLTRSCTRSNRDNWSGSILKIVEVSSYIIVQDTKVPVDIVRSLIAIRTKSRVSLDVDVLAVGWKCPGKTFVPWSRSFLSKEILVESFPGEEPFPSDAPLRYRVELLITDTWNFIKFERFYKAS